MLYVPDETPLSSLRKIFAASNSVCSDIKFDFIAPLCIRDRIQALTVIRQL